MKTWTSIGLYSLMTIAAVALSLMMVGCGGKSKAADTPETPAAEESHEHPQGDAAAEGEKGEHPAEHPTEHPE